MHARLLGGNYVLGDELGRGATGVVYQAFPTDREREVAIKVLHPTLAHEPAARRRLLREARMATALQHPNIVQVFEVGESEDGEIFIVMQRLSGRTLGERLRQRRVLPPAEVLEILSQVADALGAAHALQIVHGDLKPGNIFLEGDERAGFVVKVLDFGLALDLTTAGDLAEQPTMNVVGTASYMSPERILGRPVDGRADIYALSAVLYEMVAGRPPYQGVTSMEVCLHHLGAPLPLLYASGLYPPPMSAAIANLVGRGMAKDPAQRVPTVAAFRHELVAALTGRTGAPSSPGAPAPAPPWLPLPGPPPAFAEPQPPAETPWVGYVPPAAALPSELPQPVLPPEAPWVGYVPPAVAPPSELPQPELPPETPWPDPAPPPAGPPAEGPMAGPEAAPPPEAAPAAVPIAMAAAPGLSAGGAAPAAARRAVPETGPVEGPVAVVLCVQLDLPERPRGGEAPGAGLAAEVRRLVHALGGRLPNQAEGVLWAIFEERENVARAARQALQAALQIRDAIRQHRASARERVFVRLTLDMQVWPAGTAVPGSDPAAVRGRTQRMLPRVPQDGILASEPVFALGGDDVRGECLAGGSRSDPATRAWLVLGPGGRGGSPTPGRGAGS